MFARKLKALGWHHPDSFSIQNESDIRNLIVWLEDLKIRLYKMEDRTLLRDVNSATWVFALKKYLADLECPVENLSQKSAVINWLLSRAVQLEYTENSEKYNKADEERKSRQSRVTQDLLKNLNDADPQLRAGIEAIRSMLNIPMHHDSTLVLQAITKVIEERLSDKAISDKKQVTSKEEYLSLENITLGFNTYDSTINDAAKILRLLQIHNLRELQTRINQAIVSVQKLSAEPKTDQSLGKVGR